MGYGEYFTHSTGHGLGILVHDSLAISPRSETVLKEGMVFTVEPGIYVEGLGGVRIEDDVVVTKDGCEILTKSKPLSSSRFNASFAETIPNWPPCSSIRRTSLSRISSLI